MNLPRLSQPSRMGLDMVPMINFAFLLLIFVVLTGSQQPLQQAPVQPPQSLQAPPGQPDANALWMTADGRVAFAGEWLSDAQLPARVSVWRAAHPQTPLQLQADAHADAARVVQVLQRLRASGINEVSILAQRRPAT
ncbi:MAG: ExbD/TolR family protein [Stenotrophobium sp.]